MPKWKKSSPALVERFEAALPRDPRVEPKKMFGYRSRRPGRSTRWAAGP